MCVREVRGGGVGGHTGEGRCDGDPWSLAEESSCDPCTTDCLYLTDSMSHIMITYY